MPAKVSVPVPDSLSSLLHRFRSCFTAPGYELDFRSYEATR